MNNSQPIKNLHSNVIQIGKNQIELNHKGFLINFNDWNNEIAIALAKADQLELTDVHWFTINFIRDYYREYKTQPSLRKFKKALNKKMSSFRNIEPLYIYFPHGGYKHACRLAGLPDYYGYSC